jgi:AcrR family transcriptional regulator
LSLLSIGGIIGAMTAAPRTAREIARAEITARILDTARAHLAEDGAAGLSLRAVARDLGMVSSAVYRYFPSRDDLLTRLITEAYDSLGEAAERAEARVAREDVRGRWRATCRAVRTWALAHPHEYALVYGTPVPGYEAPEATTGPAWRVPRILIRLLADLVASEQSSRRRLPTPPASPAARRALRPLRVETPAIVPDDLLMTGVLAWTGVFGLVSFELFGHLHGVVDERSSLRQAFFDTEVDRLAGLLGLTGVTRPARAARAGRRAT